MKKQIFIKIWTLIILVIVLGIFVYFRFLTPWGFSSSCKSTLDCYIRFSPAYFFKGHRTQCINKRCIMLFPGEIQPLGK